MGPVAIDNSWELSFLCSGTISSCRFRASWATAVWKKQHKMDHTENMVLPFPSSILDTGNFLPLLSPSHEIFFWCSCTILSCLFSRIMGHWRLEEAA